MRSLLQHADLAPYLAAGLSAWWRRMRTPRRRPYRTRRGGWRR